jgi:uridine kinase
MPCIVFEDKISDQDQDSFYKPLTAEQSAKAFACDYDFDSPEAIDFDVLVENLKDLKTGLVIYAWNKLCN